MRRPFLVLGIILGFLGYSIWPAASQVGAGAIHTCQMQQMRAAVRAMTLVERADRVWDDQRAQSDVFRLLSTNDPVATDVVGVVGMIAFLNCAMEANNATARELYPRWLERLGQLTPEATLRYYLGRLEQGPPESGFSREEVVLLERTALLAARYTLGYCRTARRLLGYHLMAPPCDRAVRLN